MQLILRSRRLFAWLAGLHMPTLLREAVTAQSHAGNSAPGHEVRARPRANLPGSKSPPGVAVAVPATVRREARPPGLVAARVGRLLAFGCRGRMGC